jgi:RHS repeat-associated protein
VLNDAAASYTPGVSERRSGTSKFYHGERQGSNVAESDASQTTTATKAYDAFGMLSSSSGSSSSPFGFVGQQGYQSDGDSGLMLLGHRYYDASTGRFLTRDTEYDGRNWYVYVSSNPLRELDPTGNGPHHYATASGAVKLAGEIYGDVSVKHNKEIGGWVFKDNHGKFGFTVLELGEHGGNLGSPPPGSVGFWHTHPHFAKFTDMGEPLIFSDTPSPTDKQIFNSFGAQGMKLFWIVCAEDQSVHKFNNNGKQTGQFPISTMPPTQ